MPLDWEERYFPMPDDHGTPLDKTPLGFETTRGELLRALLDIKYSIVHPAPDPDAEHPDFKTDPKGWSLWFEGLRRETVQADARYRLLERRHGPEVLLDLYDEMVRLQYECDGFFFVNWSYFDAIDLPPVPKEFDFADVLLLAEISADSERVAEAKQDDERWERLYEGERDDTLRTYDELAHVITYVYGKYEVEGHSRECGLELAPPTASGPVSDDASREAFEQHLWDHTVADARWIRLQTRWGLDTLVEAMRRQGEFEVAYWNTTFGQRRERGLQPGEKDPRPYGDVQRAHATLRRMLASQFGLDEELPLLE